MGIKDNFSQAVKELWKKEGQGDSGSQQGGSEPSEIQKYLDQQKMESGMAVPPGVEVNASGVPLETPYYPNNPTASAQNTGNAVQPNAQQTAQTQPAQTYEPAPEIGGVNRNVQSIQDARADSAETAPDAQQPYNQNAQAAQNNPQNYGQDNTAYDNNGGGYVPPAGGGYVPPAGGGYVPPVGGGYGNGGYVPPASGGGIAAQMAGETEEMTIISKNTAIDGNVRSLANMTIDGNIKGNVETTRNIEMSGKIIGDITCNNVGMNSAAMQGNVSLKGRIKMDRDTILIGDLSSQYADINGRIRGKLDIVGKAELKRDAIVFGDINASTIAVTDGAIIQGYVNTTFLSKEDSRNVFPDAISLDNKENKGGAAPNTSNS